MYSFQNQGGIPRKCAQLWAFTIYHNCSWRLVHAILPKQWDLISSVVQSKKVTKIGICTILSTTCVSTIQLNFSTWKNAIENWTPCFTISEIFTITAATTQSCSINGAAQSQFILKLSSLHQVDGCPQPPASVFMN